MPLLISLKVALSATLITLLLGVPTAYFMANYRGRGRTLLDSALLLPLVLPPTVVGFLLLWLLGNQGPLSLLPAPFNRLAQSVVFTKWAAVITAVVVSFPLMYRAGRAAFDQVDGQLLAVARSLGASEWGVFYRVAVPLAGPGLMAGALLAFARGLGEFGATLMLAGNIPGKTQTLPMAVYFAVEGGDFRTAAGWSAVIVVISAVSVALANAEFWQVAGVGWAFGRRFRLSKKGLGCPPHRVSRASDRLEVNIVKRLPRFTLQVKFQTADALLGILGESGAGKSLLLRCLAGVDTPDSGRIVLGDRVLYDSSQGIDLPSRDRAVALLFQNYALFPHLTVAQNVAFGLLSQATLAKASAKIVSEELAAVNMSDFADDYPQRLSGGQQQRVALARALATRPELLLLDEPFSALDTHLRSHLSQQLFNRLSTYPGNALLVTHSLTEACRASHLLVIHHGQILRQDSPERIFEQPQLATTAQLTGPYNLSVAHLVTNLASGLPSDFTSDLASTYVQGWEMALRLSSSAEAALRQSPKIFSVGIRPQNVSFITSNKCENYQTQPEPTAKIAFSNPADRLWTNQPPPANQPPNQACCWPVHYWPLPDKINLFVKLHTPPEGSTDYHLQAILSHQAWQQLQQQPLPWTVYLPPQYLIVLRP
ncbi:MAG: molybdate ABC transporter permease subunit [Phormidesmis sp.]